MLQSQPFLWPDPPQPACIQAGAAAIAAAVAPAKASAIDGLERAFGVLFSCEPPVVFSSARAGLSAMIQVLGLGRADTVWVPRFSSHCVLESISRFATPTPTFATLPGEVAPAAAVIYHQWGYPHTLGQPFAGVLLDDAVDTYFKPGQSPLLQHPIQLTSPPSERRFTLWSLSKVLGGWGGGVVFARDRADYSALVQVRDQRSASVAVQAKSRIAAFTQPNVYDQWAGAESLAGAPCVALTEQLAEQLTQYPQRFAAVAVRVAALQQALPAATYVPVATSGELPCNIALTHPALVRAPALLAALTAGARRFPLHQQSCGPLQLALPLPLHDGVSDATFARLLAVAQAAVARTD